MRSSRPPHPWLLSSASAGLMLLLAVAPLPASADPAEEFDGVCAAALAVPDPSPAPAGAPVALTAAGTPALSIPQQKKPYCQAAQSALEGAKVDSTLWKVWAGVAGVCTYACAASFTGMPSHELVCTGASLAGGVTDAVMAKNFASILTSVMSVGGGFLVNRMTASSDAEIKAGKKDRDWGACLSAGMAGIQVFTKVNSMKSNESSAETNLESAKKVSASTASALTATGANAGFQPQSVGATGGTTGTGGVANTTGDALAANPNDPAAAKTGCAGVGTAGQTAGNIISCAVTSDKNLPGFVTNPKFARDFNKASNQTLGDFLSNSTQTPSQALNSAMGGSLSAAQKTKLSEAISDLEAKLPYDPKSYYASVGGGAGAGGGEGDDMAMIAQMMAGLTDQLNPGAKKADPNTGVTAVAFANKNRTPAAVAEDPKLSIFDRVAYRYYFLAKRMTEGGP